MTPIVVSADRLEDMHLEQSAPAVGDNGVGCVILRREKNDRTAARLPFCARPVQLKACG